MVQNSCYVERASKNKRITNEKTTALNLRAVFLMLSFQCLRELERKTGFEPKMVSNLSSGTNRSF